MVIITADGHVIKPFRVSRYVKEGSRVDIAPKVSRVELVPLKVDNLKVVERSNILEYVNQEVECDIHDSCMGHLPISSSGRVGLPPYCAREGVVISDDRGRLNKSFLTENMHRVDFANGVRSTMMGKKGELRFGGMGMKPLTSVRGVAVCKWNISPNEVLLPKSWMEKMKVPTVASTSALASPYWRFRSAVDGDRAVLIRCPAISNSSSMPVFVKGRDERSIGVHPAMCDHLNLDFDGDEVHVTIVDALESKAEIESLMVVNGASDKFRASRVRGLFKGYEGIADEDYMTRSTLSVTEVDSGIEFGPVHTISRCKSRSWERMSKMLGNGETIKNAVVNSERALKQIVKSHLNVSKGFTFSRQMKICCFTMDHDDVELFPFWLNRENVGACSLIPPSSSTLLDYGFPGARLVSQIGGLVMQAALDTAKHIGDKPREDAFLSMVGCSKSRFYCYSKKGELLFTQKKGKVAGATLVALSSRDELMTRRMNDAMVHLLRFMEIVCKDLNLRPTQAEKYHVALFLYYSLFVTDARVVSDYVPVSFLSFSDSDFLTVAIAENVPKADRIILEREAIQVLSCSNPVVAMLLGNFSNIDGRSCRHHRLR